MEHHENPSNPHVPYRHMPSYQANQMPRPIIPAPHHHLAHPVDQTQLDQQLQQFWAKQSEEASLVTDFKTQSLPLARIKKIMKSDEEVKMISSEVPMLFAKACEMFIMELTLRSWSHTNEHKRRTLQKSDVITAMAKNDVYDFLVDIVPRDDIKEEAESNHGGGDFMPLPCEGSTYYYVPPPPPPHMGNRTNVHQTTQAYMAQSMWPQPPPPPYAAGSYKQV